MQITINIKAKDIAEALENRVQWNLDGNSVTSKEFDIMEVM